MKTIMEPFRIKMTEPIKTLSAEEREIALKKAHHNVFLLDGEDCPIDLLTDSGTGAMSSQQWAALMLGDESYAGSRSWKKFKSTIQEITGMDHVFPTHQGRAAESLLAMIKVKPGDVIPNNSHFDTTRANMQFAGAKTLDLLTEEGLNPASELPFKGNMDLQKLEACIQEYGDRIPFCMITVTNNTGGGQPVSMENIKAVKGILDAAGIPLVIDACRFAENSYFIKQREAGYEDKSLMEIAQEIFGYADAATMSLKKDGLANIGGFFVCNNAEWAEAFQNLLILKEGFPTYGGLAGRDLEVTAVGLKEALEYDYQVYRHASIEYLMSKLDKAGIPMMRPAGGHAVFLDARAFMDHIPALEYPGIALVNAIYLVGGVRTVELGTVMFGHFDEQGKEIPAPLELVRMAFPRRVYTQSHFDHLVEVILEVWENRKKYSGYRIIRQAKYLRHFTCHFEPLGN